MSIPPSGSQLVGLSHSDDHLFSDPFAHSEEGSKIISRARNVLRVLFGNGLEFSDDPDPFVSLYKHLYFPEDHPDVSSTICFSSTGGGSQMSSDGLTGVNATHSAASLILIPAFSAQSQLSYCQSLSSTSSVEFSSSEPGLIMPPEEIIDLASE